VSLYVHIPFCLAKCGYCDFLSWPVSEIAGAGEGNPDLLKAVLIGGGTPIVPDSEAIYWHAPRH